jgi:tRNA threonylcarbamoyladenosine biosynthesis protein TsaB
MARILLIETATEVCSAAIAVDGVVVALQEELHCTSHAALLTLQIEACVRQSGIPLQALDAVAVSRGPGSYTALRVGASVAKGICYALEKPLIAVDTLLALAAASLPNEAPTDSLTPPTFLMPMLDARRQEVWTAVYDAEMNVLAPAQPLIMDNNLFENFILTVIPSFSNTQVILSGNGVSKIENVRSDKEAVLTSKKICSSADLAPWAERYFQSADFQNIVYWEPFYMKLPNITTSVKKI